MKRTIAAVTGFALFAQVVGPMTAFAHNPFAAIPGPSQSAPTAAAGPLAQPTARPTSPASPTLSAGGSRATAPACMSPSASRSPLTEFERWVNDYISAHDREDLLLADRIKHSISASVFASPGSAEYMRNLRTIDAHAAQSPVAIYDLARTLQMRWEALYTPGLGKIRMDTLNTATQRGLIVGLVAYGALLWRRPMATPRYFSLWSRLLPLLAHEALPVGSILGGQGVGHGLNRVRDGLRNLPPAPAHVMRLGLASNDYPYDHNILITELETLIGSASTGLAAYRLTRVLQVAATASRATALAGAPADGIPPVLAASLLALGASFVTEEIAVHAIDQHEIGRFNERVIAARSWVQRSLAQQNIVELHRAADALIMTSINLSTYLNREVEAALSDMREALASAERRFGRNSPQYAQESISLLEQANTKIREAASRFERGADEDYHEFLTLGFLANHDREAIEALGDDAPERAHNYLASYDAWNARQENRTRASSADSFEQFIQAALTRKDRQLARDFRSGTIRRHPNAILLQAAAYLRTTGNAFLEDRANELLAMINRNELWIRNAQPEYVDAVVEGPYTPPPHTDVPDGGVPYAGVGPGPQ